MSRRYNRVEPTVWLQPWDDDTRLVAFYLLTNEHRTTEGLYRLPLSYVDEDLRWDRERVQPAFDRLIAEDFIRYDEAAKVVWIVKAFERQPPENANVALAAVRRLLELPKTVLLHPFLTAARSISKPFTTVVDKRFPTLVDESQALTQALTQTPSSEDVALVVVSPPAGAANQGDPDHDLAEEIVGILQRGIDSIPEDVRCKTPTVAAVQTVLARCQPTRDVALEVATTTRSIVQSQGRAPNVVALYAQRLSALGDPEIKETA